MRQYIFRGLIIAVLALGVTSSVVFSSPFEDGKAAYDRGDYATALLLWRSAAEEGSADAQFQLGLMYHKGDSVAQDFKEALKWYRLAAEQGYAYTQRSSNIWFSHFSSMLVFGNRIFIGNTRCTKSIRSNAARLCNLYPIASGLAPF